MTHCKGTVTALHQHSGCVEVTVTGECPGTFPIDNCCLGMIFANEGNLIGRTIEYRNGHIRFLDDNEHEEPALIQFPKPACSTHHI